MDTNLSRSPLGKSASYQNTYDPGLLFPIPRREQRRELGIDGPAPFQGVDIWNAYEVSWLNMRGVPCVAVGVFTVPCDSANLIESKSLKLYLNSFNQTKFASIEQVQAAIVDDLTTGAGADVQARLYAPSEWDHIHSGRFKGICLDDLQIEINRYELDSSTLSAEGPDVEETLVSHLLKSNCLVTGQPDWGSVEIFYNGPKINHEGLLRYLISFRNHNEFHEHCIERIFVDILNSCSPKILTVHGSYTRRGGLDINPIRTNVPVEPLQKRTFRH